MRDRQFGEVCHFEGQEFEEVALDRLDSPALELDSQRLVMRRYCCDEVEKKRGLFCGPFQVEDRNPFDIFLGHAGFELAPSERLRHGKRLHVVVQGD